MGCATQVVGDSINLQFAQSLYLMVTGEGVRLGLQLALT
jgi:hypothetical protein